MASLSEQTALFLSRRSALVSTLLALITTFTIVALYYNQNPFLEAFEAKSYDLRFKNIRGAIKPNEQIAIIAIDDKSIGELGRFPWTRSAYIPLLENLSAAGAKAVLFDAFYPEPQDEVIDRAFADAIRKAGNVVLATTFSFDQQFRVTGSTGSLPLIEEAAMGIGHINLVPEDDGINRRNILLIEAEGRLVPSLGMMGAMVALDKKTFSPTPFSVELAGRSVPVDEDYAMWINYTGAAGIYPQYSFSDISQGRIDPALLKNKIFFLGATALGIYDMRVTPFHSNTPGVEVHATIADNIISNRFIRHTGLEALLDITFIILLGLLTFYLTAKLKLYIAIPITFLLSTAYIWVTYQFFTEGHWISMIYPLMAAVASLLVGGSFRYMILERRAREMRSMFSSYLSPKLVSRLEREPDAAKIGGDTKEITIIFTDIKGFTSFTENRTPLEVVERLNEYLAAMVRAINSYDGTVDKFIGDGIMIYWGAPLTQEDHAERAIGALLAMKQVLNELSVKWAKSGEEPFAFRGGVNSGEVIAGNIGSHGKKMEYTVIGDTVNLAARLESSAKYYNVDFLVSDSTYQLTKDRFIYRELDLIRVIGKQIPVTVYELVDPLSEISEEEIEQFQKALQLYRSGNWQEARAQFYAISELLPDDRPCQIYIERCNTFIDSPPPSEWDGVYDRENK
ncbi:MAG: adenylate/guanylate cyclase domain-containing protein [Gammaproteobacteria bacterium]|nr:adenylate/guanylate cyclase domain-containing protein [Gammaproteobacteria bacterium]